MTQLVEEVQGMAIEDHKVIEANGDGRDPQGRMGLWALWDQWVLEGSPGGMDYPLWLAPCLHRVGGTTSIQCKFEHHWDGKFPTLPWGVIKSCDAVPTERESKYGRTLNMTVRNQELQGKH